MLDASESTLLGGMVAAAMNMWRKPAYVPAAAPARTVTAPAELEAVRSSHPTLFAEEAYSIKELAAISSALRSMPFLLLITKPDSDRVWIASRLLANSLRCPLAAIEGHVISNLAGLSKDSKADLSAALRESNQTKISICVHKTDGELVCHTVSVMSITTPFGKIGVAIGGDITTE